MAGNADDELDALLDSYATQAAKDIKKVEAKSNQAASKQLRKEGAAREAGLAQPMSEESKGFKLLSAMGYVAGAGLGAWIMYAAALLVWLQQHHGH
jgi:hypothetical protein